MATLTVNPMNQSPLSFPVKLSFGIGQFAEGLKNAAFGTLLIFYYNQVLGLPGTMAGIAVGIAVIVDAFTDPLAGSVSDHWHSRHGRRHPFMYASMVPLAIAFYFLFNPLVSGEWALFFWLLIFTNATRTAMSLYHVPHIALGAEMTVDFSERSELVGFRMFFSNFGVLFVFGAGFGYFFAATPEFPNGQLNASVYPNFAAVVSVLMVITIFISAWGTRSVIPSLPSAPDIPRASALEVIQRVFKDLFAAMKSKSFRWLFSGVLVVFIMVGVNTALDLYIFTYFWELEPGSVLYLIIAYPIGVMIGSFASPAFFRRWGKKAGLIFGGLAWPLWQVVPIALRLLGWFPENGDALLLPLLIFIKFFQGACTVQANVAFGSMVADVVDEYEYDTGKRQEGIFFAASSFSAKATTGVGNVIAGFSLDIINWPRGAHIRTAADVPAETIIDLGLVYGPLVAAFGFLSIWCYSHYKLTRERHEEILESLNSQRASQG
ncbi:MAG: MFS transporter [Pseudomonadales bacterium]|nr:MFS transporter [Pseudomonadales bacterium]